MAAANAVKVHIDAWSDIACPWCYVGKVWLHTVLHLCIIKSDLLPKHKNFLHGEQAKVKRHLAILN